MVDDRQAKVRQEQLLEGDVGLAMLHNSKAATTQLGSRWGRGADIKAVAWGRSKPHPICRISIPCKRWHLRVWRSLRYGNTLYYYKDEMTPVGTPLSRELFRLWRHLQNICPTCRAGTLLWVYRQYIGMPYIALAQQAWIYCNISDSRQTSTSRN